MGRTVYRTTRDGYVDEPEEEYQETEEYGYDHVEEVEPRDGESSGLFATPARAAALIGSLVLLVAIMSLVFWIMTTRNQPAKITPPVAGSINVPVITSSAATRQGEAPAKGSFAPDFAWVDPGTGKPISISALKKPVFINFWGTWCPPCRAEMPEMQRLYNQYKGQVEFIGVSMAPRDNPGLVASFVNAAGYDWLFVQDDTYDVATRYQVQAVPSSYFIGTDGVIKAVHVGGMNGAIMESYLAQIK